MVGGGHEINTGKAGLPEWFDSLRRAFPDWDVYIIPQLNDNEYRRGRSWSSMLEALHTFERDKLHLATSVRSFRTPDLTAFVEAVLDADTDEAKTLHQRIKDKYPIVITRTRQDMAIFVPVGSDKDQTRKREWYDEIYGYLKEIGILEILEPV